MFPKKGIMVCGKCGYEETAADDSESVIKEESEIREVAIFEDELDTLPTTAVTCPKCGHNLAYWVLRQTRAADEPPTRIYRCVKCKHSWREY